MIAYGNLNLKPKEFWDEISPRDFLKMCEGFNFKKRVEDEKYLLQLKLVRWVGWLQYYTNPYIKNKSLTPDQLFRLPEIKQIKKVEIPTKEEMKWFSKWKK